MHGAHSDDDAPAMLVRVPRSCADRQYRGRACGGGGIWSVSCWGRSCAHHVAFRAFCGCKRG
eukprot:7168444-Prymnesium_polylepis.1